MLIRELQSLCLGVDILDKNNQVVDIREEDEYSDNVAETARELDLDIGQQGDSLPDVDDAGEYDDYDDYDDEVDIDSMPTASELDKLEKELVQYKVTEDTADLSDLDKLDVPDDYPLDLDE